MSGNRHSECCEKTWQLRHQNLWLQKLKTQINNLNHELSKAQEEHEIRRISEELEEKIAERTEIESTIKQLRNDISATKRSTSIAIRSMVFPNKDEFADHPVMQQKLQEERERKNGLQERLRNIRLAEELQEYYHEKSKEKNTTFNLPHSPSVQQSASSSSSSSFPTTIPIPQTSSFVEESLQKKNLADKIATI